MITYGKLIPYHYFLNGEYIGEGQQPEEFRGEKYHRGHNMWFWAPHSWFAYCPCCGDVWARGLSSHPEARHLALKCNCRTHGGGSLLMFATEEEAAYLPVSRELMLYELDLYLEDPKGYCWRNSIKSKCQ
jgi:hypothetical protein